MHTSSIHYAREIQTARIRQFRASRNWEDRRSRSTS